MLSFIRQFLPQLFVAVILDDEKFTIKAIQLRSNNILTSEEKSFDKEDKFLEHLKLLSKRFHFHYTGLLLDSKEQGLAMTLDEKEFEKLGVGKISIKTMPLNNAFIYTATEHIDYFDSFFEKSGELDFIFSPLALLYYCVRRSDIDPGKTILYVFKHKKIMSLLICKDRKILIGKYHFIEDEAGLEMVDEDGDLGTILDDIDLSGLDDEKIEDKKEEKKDIDLNLDNFDETLDDKLAQLDQLDDVLNEDDTNVKVDFGDEKIEIDELNQFSNDMEFCRNIIKNLEEFYKDERYQGSFIDELLIFASEPILQGALDFLEGEIFVSPSVKEINTYDLLLELMQKELK
ncbi:MULTISPECIES: clan AA aspartic protease [unclassified Campylobacter]|uniref:clan AA aspartic protease n=1 Tax=unclassified Campylobacter TaxID=2593542 RepID=UPI001237DC00|nr:MULTISPECIES: clan AA aspartic protease [unclassified Campylobacter]KAA6224953.1 clan AA aspartic protease [Campylobacter sp. LR286c]KAA6228869.1 clan AA aspartic protease [Campylobacter sp. LR196d]KAA6229823.1 clan AA aspartic protease [Campylobacter sp. LR264d]